MQHSGRSVSFGWGRWPGVTSADESNSQQKGTLTFEELNEGTFLDKVCLLLLDIWSGLHIIVFTILDLQYKDTEHHSLDLIQNLSTCWFSA